MLAFARSLGDAHLITVVPRLASALLDGSAQPLIPAGRWGDTRVLLPEDCAGLCRSAVFPAGDLGDGDSLPLAGALAQFPVNLICLKPYPEEPSHEHR